MKTAKRINFTHKYRDGEADKIINTLKNISISELSSLHGTFPKTVTMLTDTINDLSNVKDLPILTKIYLLGQIAVRCETLALCIEMDREKIGAEETEKNMQVLSTFMTKRLPLDILYNYAAMSGDTDDADDDDLGGEARLRSLIFGSVPYFDLANDDMNTMSLYNELASNPLIVEYVTTPFKELQEKDVHVRTEEMNQIVDLLDKISQQIEEYGDERGGIPYLYKQLCNYSLYIEEFMYDLKNDLKQTKE